MGAKTTVDVDGRTLSLSNLDKVLYPETGFTKGQLIDYYARIAPVLLPHVRDRPVSVVRHPSGVDSKGFFAKNAPAGTPDWVRLARLPAPGSTKNREEIDYVVVDDVPTLTWLANLAAIELHVPQWTVDSDGKAREVDLLVLDLDPGAPATAVECARVASWLRERLDADGLALYPKTSGGKGLQLYAPLERTHWETVWNYAHALARELEASHPDLVVSRMTKALRPGKVLIDWSQNNSAKTTVAPYSVRARPAPTVSTPLTWDEVEACDDPESVRFTSDQVLARVDKHGDLLAPLCEKDGRGRLPG